MTIQIEDVALARFLDGPAPYSSGNPVPSYQTAQQDLADALEGQAPHFSKTLADQLGPTRTAELAQVVRRAVAVGIRRRAELELTERLHGVFELLEDGLRRVEPDCVSTDA